MTQPATADDILRAAARLLEHEGWIQNQPHQPGGGWCLIAAVMYAGSELDQWGATTEVALDRLAARVGTLGTLAIWNDAPGRTRAEVLALLEAAIVRPGEYGNPPREDAETP